MDSGGSIEGDGGGRGPGVRARLAGMMAGVYIVQGAWYPLLAVHLQDLGIDGRARGAIFATMSIAALLTPLGAGQLADRFISAQRLMAILYALATGLLGLLAAGLVTGPVPLFGLLLLYWLIVAPASGLSNAVALRNLDRPSLQFGGVRLWGTVGWMAAGWSVAGIMAARGSTRAGEGAYEAFAVAAIAAALMSAYCLSLPDTPPLNRRGRHGSGPPSRGFDPAEALALLRRPGLGVFFLLGFGVSLTMPYVYQVVPPHLEHRGLPRPWVAAAMTLGQVLEIAALAMLPRAIGLFRYRGALALGILAWLGFFGLLALRLPLPLGLIGLPLQGVAIALFHIAGPMYLDREAPGNLRASAQGLYVMTTMGLGNLLGALLAGEVVTRAGGASAAVFLVPLAIDAALLVVLLLAFRPEGEARRQRPPSGAAARAHALSPDRGEAA